MFKTIKAQGFEIKKNLEIEVFILKFPDKWIEDFMTNFYDFKWKKKAIKTNKLIKLLKSFSKDILEVTDLYSLKYDNTWLISQKKIDQTLLIELLTEWGDCVKETIRNFDERDKFKEWIDSLNASDLGKYEKCVLKLTDSEGAVVSNKIYSIIPKLLMNEVIKEGLVLEDKKLEFYGCEENRILSRPEMLQIKSKKENGNHYSIAINFSVQTTPGNRNPMVIYTTSIARWVEKCFKKDVLKNANTKVYVNLDEYTLYPLELSFRKGVTEWEQLSYNILKKIYIGKKIPDAYDFYKEPLKYFNSKETANLYANYRLEMGKKIMYVNSGIPMNDKFNIHYELKNLLENKYINEMEEFENVKTKKPYIFKEDIEVGTDIREFRERIFNGINKQALNIDVYSEYESKVLLNIKKQLEKDFGMDEKFDEFELNINFIHNPKILKALDENESEIARHEKRIHEIRNEIKKKPGVNACLIVLPYENEEGEKYFTHKGDPKFAIRAGFSSLACITQFLTPNFNDNIEHRVKMALFDLYRQLGYFSTCSKVKNDVSVDYSIPITALHVINFKKTPYGNTQRAFVALTQDPKAGKIFVECPALWSGSKLYWEACVAFQSVATKEGIRNFEKTRVSSDMKNKIYELYNVSKENHIMLIESNGITRAEWKFISDSEILKSEKISKYRPQYLKFGYAEAKLEVKNNSSLRIIRVRCNQEVPGYITPKKEGGKFMSKSSVFKYKGVFYGIGSRPNDKFYKNTYDAISKINSTDNKECKLTNMIELYPILLKEDDIPEQWCFLIDNYRKSAHQYKETLKLPLPLHLAYKLEEYIYKKNS
ncbi:MAG: pPIWI_RE module domain-containing protein [Sarcina sp.]